MYKLSFQQDGSLEDATNLKHYYGWNYVTGDGDAFAYTYVTFEKPIPNIIYMNMQAYPKGDGAVPTNIEGILSATTFANATNVGMFGLTETGFSAQVHHVSGNLQNNSAYPFGWEVVAKLNP